MKKCLALIIALISVLSLVAVPTFAEGEVNNSDIKFIGALGFVDLTDGEEESIGSVEISRIQLAEIFYNIIFPENINGSYGEKAFSDVPAEKQHIVSAVYALGVMRGYSDEIFGSEDKVTYAQVVKAMVSFLGYDLYAQNLGGYPSGYLAQATRLKILPGGNIPGDSIATYAGVAAMLKKAVGVDIAVWNNTQFDGTATLEVLEGVDYLKHYRGVSATKGTISGNYLTNVNGGESTNFFGIKINDINIEVTESAHGLQELLGYDVYVYYSNENGIYKALYFEEGENEVVTIPATNITSVTKGSIKYYDSSDSYTVSEANFPADTPLIYNGTFEASYTLSDINPFKDSTLSGSLVLVDNGNDGIFDVVVVKAYQTMIVSDVRNNKIYCKYNVSDNPMDKVIDISYYKERNMNIRNISGEMLTINHIKKGHVINICYDKNGIVKEIIASKDSITGVIEELSYTGGKISAIKISGMTFKTSPGLMIIDGSGKLSAGSTVDVFFNCDAEIAVIDVENRYTDGYVIGYLIDAASMGSLVKEVDSVIFDASGEGEIKQIKFAERVVFNDEVKNATDVLTSLKGGEKRAKRQVILYKTDLEGKVITAIQTAKKLVSDTETFDGFYQYPGSTWYYSGGHRKFNNDIGSSYLANTQTMAIGIPNEANRDDYTKYVITTLPTGEGSNIGTESFPTQMQVYGTKKVGMVVDIAVINAAQGDSDTSRRPFMVVSKVSEAVDEDGNTGLRIAGLYVQGTSLAEGAFFIDKELLAKGHDLGVTGDTNNGKLPFIVPGDTEIEPGDVYRVPFFNETGRIGIIDVKQFYQLYDYGTDTFATTTGKHKQSDSAIYHEMSTVVYKDDTSIKVRFADGTYGAYELSSGYYKFIEVTKNKRTGEIKAVGSTHEAILSEDTHPGSGSRVLIHYRGAGIGCIIFNDR